MTDAIHYGMLSAASGLGRIGAKKLIEAAGSASAVWSSRPSDLAARAEWPGNRLEFLKDSAELRDRVSRDLESAAVRGVQIFCPSDSEYPAGLWDLADPPLLLFVLGRVPVPERTVGMVGTRTPSPAGTRNARDLAAAWACGGLAVVSGLARGVDTAAHQGALDAGGWTIALLGGGILTAYPPENRALQERIVKEGTLISEYGLETEPRSHHFPERNRLIAAISRAVVVVEAPQKSGALITADLALEIGREVMAVPGDIRLIQAKGSNALIRQGAAPVFEPEDLWVQMNWKSKKPAPSVMNLNGEEEPADAESSGIAEIDQKILKNAEQSESVSVESLSLGLGDSASELLAALTRLEMAGRLRSVAGSRWEAVRVFV